MTPVKARHLVTYLLDLAPARIFRAALDDAALVLR